MSQSLSTAAIDVGAVSDVGVDIGTESTTTYFRALDFFSATLLPPPLPSADVLGDVSVPTIDANLDVISATTIGSRLGRRLVC